MGLRSPRALPAGGLLLWRAGWRLPSSLAARGRLALWRGGGGRRRRLAAASGGGGGKVRGRSGVGARRWTGWSAAGACGGQQRLRLSCRKCGTSFPSDASGVAAHGWVPTSSVHAGGSGSDDGGRRWQQGADGRRRWRATPPAAGRVGGGHPRGRRRRRRRHRSRPRHRYRARGHRPPTGAGVRRWQRPCRGMGASGRPFCTHWRSRWRGEGL